jgi:hypothetical protein
VLLLPAFSSFLSLSISDCGFAVFGSVGFSFFTAPSEAGAFGDISGADLSFGLFCNRNRGAYDEECRDCENRSGM